MTGNFKEISEFWNLFCKHESRLISSGIVNNQIFNTILKKLQEISPGIFIEFASEPINKELTITAEGDRSLFPLVDSVVSQAPELPGWTIFALRQKNGFPVTVAWEDYVVSIADIVFTPLERSSSRDLGLRIFVRGLDKNDTRKCHNAILRAIDYGLGERKFAESVLVTQVVQLPEGGNFRKYMPLVDLEEFVKKRQATDHF